MAAVGGSEPIRGVSTAGQCPLEPGAAVAGGFDVRGNTARERRPARTRAAAVRREHASPIGPDGTCAGAVGVGTRASHVKRSAVTHDDALGAITNADPAVRDEDTVVIAVELQRCSLPRAPSHCEHAVLLCEKGDADGK